MKYIYLTVSGIFNFVSGMIMANIPGMFIIMSIMYIIEFITGYSYDPTLEKDAALGILIIAITVGFVSFLILILVNIQLFKRSGTEKLFYCFYGISLWVLGAVSYFYYKIYIF
nr:hypothetical protein [Evansella caseinilytica]